MKSSITQLTTRSVQGPFDCLSAPLASVGLQGETSVCTQAGQAERWLRVDVCVCVLLRTLCVGCVWLVCEQLPESLFLHSDPADTHDEWRDIVRADEPKRSGNLKNWFLMGWCEPSASCGISSVQLVN